MYGTWGGGLIWGYGTDNGEDNGEGGPAGTANGARQAREGGGGKTWVPLVGYVQPYQEAYVWDGAD